MAVRLAPVTRRPGAFLPGPLVFTAYCILLIRRAFFINLAFTILFECYNLLELQNSVKPFRRNIHLCSQLCHLIELLLASGNRVYMREEGGAEESKASWENTSKTKRFQSCFRRSISTNISISLESLRKTTPHEIMYSHTVAKISVV